MCHEVSISVVAVSLKKKAELMGLPLDQHVTNVITFMRERADDRGLRGTL